MKELKEAQSYFKIIGVARGMAQGARALTIETPPMTKV